jgi:hypothetical protein
LAYSALNASVGLTDTARRAGNPPGEQRHSLEHRDHADQDQWIRRRRVEQQRFHPASRGEGNDQSRTNADRSQDSPTTDNQRRNRPGLRAQGEPHTDLVPPPRDSVRHDAVEPKSGDNQREHRAQPERDHPEAERTHLAIEALREHSHID